MTSPPVLVKAGGVVAPRSDLRLGLLQQRIGTRKLFLPFPASVNFKSKMKNHSSQIALPTSFHVFLLENLA